MEAVHNNYDAVFKDAMTLFKDKTLDFLGISGIAPITEPLRTESVQVEVKSEFVDLLFGTSDGKGLHLEEEVALSRDDLLRFAGYHVNHRRTYMREFVTVIFVKEPTSTTEVNSGQFSFKPLIVQCSQIDADSILTRLRQAIENGEPFNELELIYLPLFKSIKYTPTELFTESAKLVRNVRGEVNYKQKLGALLITLAHKIIDKSALDSFAEEVRAMGNVILEYFEELGEKRGLELGEKRGALIAIENTARKMMTKGYDTLDIIDITGLSTERLREIRTEVKAEAAQAV